MASQGQSGVLAGLLRPPRFRVAEEEGGERHATWFELFFDLVFVVAVAELAHGLAEDASLAGFARFGAGAAPRMPRHNFLDADGSYRWPIER